MNTFIEPFLLGLTLHAGLLFNAIYQNGFILTRALSGKPMLGVISVFILSSLVISVIGVYLLDSLTSDNHYLEQTVSIIGASILLYQAIKAYRYARFHHSYATSTGDMFIAITMIWLTPHLYADMFIISSVALTRPASEYIPLIVGFVTMAALWFSLLAFGSAKLAKIYASHKIHTAMHYASSFILAALSLSLILQVFFEIGHTH